MANGFLAIRSITLQDPFLDFYEDTKVVKLVFYRELYDIDAQEIYCKCLMTYEENIVPTV